MQSLKRLCALCNNSNKVGPYQYVCLGGTKEEIEKHEAAAKILKTWVVKYEKSKI
jgi:hypothetical protein